MSEYLCGTCAADLVKRGRILNRDYKKEIHGD